MSHGLVIAAPTSGSGKTTLTLGILRALAEKGYAVRSAKSGPDYIDGAFHAHATGQTCVNLDAWAMTPDRLRTLAQGKDLLIVEGAMGLFDGAAHDGSGSTADVAAALRLPIVLVVDASRQSQSIAALVHGFATYRQGTHIAGIILNKVGSTRHIQGLTAALLPLGIPVLGTLPNTPEIELPSRHLGLVQAEERADLDAFLTKVARHISDHIPLTSLIDLAEEIAPPKLKTHRLYPPAQRIAVAKDAAFAFAYPHLLMDWRAKGADLAFFSPLADDPVPDADFVLLPGGYPELHAGRLAANATFMSSLRAAPQVYGECGGYMVMGDGLIDKEGRRHAMAGLLRLETSFETPKRHLGYRHLKPLGGPWTSDLMGHEFHYASTVRAEGSPLFDATDAAGKKIGSIGLRHQKHAGSFAHVIDAAPPAP
ncbi:MAG: cobyrinate a,c-diamide synthase [Pseudomonadota bacterium]